MDREEIVGLFDGAVSQWAESEIDGQDLWWEEKEFWEGFRKDILREFKTPSAFIEALGDEELREAARHMFRTNKVSLE